MSISIRKKVFLTVIMSVFIVFTLYKVVTMPPKLMNNKSISYKTSAKNFYNEFIQNQTQFDKLHMNEVIGLTGIITSVQDSIIVLDDKIVCITTKSYAHVAPNQLIKIKGKYIGYDELFDNLKLSECLLDSF